jgi:hypothetical protein
MVLSILTTLAFLISAGSTQAAFVPTENFAFSRNVPSVRQSALQPLNMMDASDVFSSANSLLLATIDSDIAAIPDNEFAPIFAGGIVSNIFWRPAAAARSSAIIFSSLCLFVVWAHVMLF